MKSLARLFCWLCATDLYISRTGTLSTKRTCRVASMNTTMESASNIQAGILSLVWSFGRLFISLFSTATKMRSYWKANTCLIIIRSNYTSFMRETTELRWIQLWHIQPNPNLTPHKLALESCGRKIGSITTAKWATASRWNFGSSAIFNARTRYARPEYFIEITIPRWFPFRLAVQPKRVKHFRLANWDAIWISTLWCKFNSNKTAEISVFLAFRLQFYNSLCLSMNST